MASRINKVKIGIVPTLQINLWEIGKRMEIADVHVFGITEQVKESKTDIVVIPDNIGLNPYSDNITGWLYSTVSGIAHRFLHKNIGSLLNSEIKIFGIGDGAYYLYTSMGGKVDFDSWESRENHGFVERDGIEYIRNSGDYIIGFAYNNCYGICDKETFSTAKEDMWERILLDLFNPMDGSMVETPPPSPTPTGNWNDE